MLYKVHSSSAKVKDTICSSYVMRPLNEISVCVLYVSVEFVYLIYSCASYITNHTLNVIIACMMVRKPIEKTNFKHPL